MRDRSNARRNKEFVRLSDAELQEFLESIPDGQSKSDVMRQRMLRREKVRDYERAAPAKDRPLTKRECLRLAELRFDAFQAIQVERLTHELIAKGITPESLLSHLAELLKSDLPTSPT